MSKLTFEGMFVRRLAILLGLVFVGVGTPVGAQGLFEKVTKAAKGFASVTTEAGMIGALNVDLETRNLPTVTVGETSVGVSQIDFKESVGVRIHIYYLNATDQPVSIPIPTDQTFVLVDGKGRRLLFLALRLKDTPKGATTLTIPALERVNLTALYNLPAGVGGEAILKVGTSGMIRGIPLGDGQSVSPGLSVTSDQPALSVVPPTPPPDATSADESAPAIAPVEEVADPQGQAVYDIPDRVEVNYGGTWYRGIVIAVQNGKYQVKRNDYTSDDRWVTAADLRVPAPETRKMPAPKSPLPATVPGGAYSCITVVAGFMSNASSTSSMGTIQVTGSGSYTGLSKTGSGAPSSFTYDAASGAINWEGGNLKGFFGKVVESQLGFDHRRVPHIRVTYRVREGGNLFDLSCLREGGA